MRKSIVFMLVVLIAATTVYGQAYRGTGRLQGVVTDTSGKPLQGAKVTLFSTKANGGPAPLTTDKNGKWAALGLISGTWNVDVEMQGYKPEKGSVQISESQRIPPVKTQLEKAEAEVIAEAEVPMPKTGVPQEAVDAVNAAQAMLDEAEGRVLLTEEMTDARKKQLYVDATKKFETALTVLPDDAENAKTRLQIQQVLAQTYYKAGELAKAVDMLKKVAAANPDNVGVQMLLANLLLENGMLEEGKAVLEKLPAGTMTDPTAIINVGILFLNKAQLKDAWTWFDKAVNLDPKRGESYYYRGLSLVQQQKMKEARADFERVIELAPGSTEAKDAQDLLKQMK